MVLVILPEAVNAMTMVVVEHMERGVAIANTKILGSVILLEAVGHMVT